MWAGRQRQSTLLSSIPLPWPELLSVKERCLRVGRGDISIRSVGLHPVGCGKQMEVSEEQLHPHAGFPSLNHPGEAPALWPVTPD